MSAPAAGVTRLGSSGSVGSLGGRRSPPPGTGTTPPATSSGGILFTRAAGGAGGAEDGGGAAVAAVAMDDRVHSFAGSPLYTALRKSGSLGDEADGGGVSPARTQGSGGKRSPPARAWGVTTPPRPTRGSPRNSSGQGRPGSGIHDDDHADTVASPATMEQTRSQRWQGAVNNGNGTGNGTENGSEHAGANGERPRSSGSGDGSKPQRRRSLKKRRSSRSGKNLLKMDAGASPGAGTTSAGEGDGTATTTAMTDATNGAADTNTDETTKSDRVAAFIKSSRSSSGGSNQDAADGDGERRSRARSPKSSTGSGSRSRSPKRRGSTTSKSGSKSPKRRGSRSTSPKPRRRGSTSSKAKRRASRRASRSSSRSPLADSDQPSSSQRPSSQPPAEAALAAAQAAAAALLGDQYRTDEVNPYVAPEEGGDTDRDAADEDASPAIPRLDSQDMVLTTSEAVLEPRESGNMQNGHLEGAGNAGGDPGSVEEPLTTSAVKASVAGQTWFTTSQPGPRVSGESIHSLLEESSSTATATTTAATTTATAAGSTPTKTPSPDDAREAQRSAFKRPQLDASVASGEAHEEQIHNEPAEDGAVGISSSSASSSVTPSALSMSLSLGPGTPGSGTPLSAQYRETSRANVRRSVDGELRSVNHYRVLSSLGRGSFAEVKLCTLKNEETGELDKFAVKIFSKSLLNRRKTIFRDSGRTRIVSELEKVKMEIAIMKKLEHPNLVRLYEVIDDPRAGQLFIVMEYLPRGCIMDYDSDADMFKSKLSGGDTLGEAVSARSLRGIFNGLAYLHLQHVAHRDLKPENVLVDENGVVKIADFGVSHFFEDEVSREPRTLHQLMRSASRGIVNKTEGTWSFWAPEMTLSMPFSAYSADVWACGVCLWVFTFGTLPFRGNDPEELFENIRTQDLNLPHRVSPEMESMLRGLLHKDPAQRLTIEQAARLPLLVQTMSAEEISASTTTVLANDVVHGERILPSCSEVDHAFTPVEDITVKNVTPKVSGMLRKRLVEARSRVNERRETLNSMEQQRLSESAESLGDLDEDGEDEASSIGSASLGGGTTSGDSFDPEGKPNDAKSLESQDSIDSFFAPEAQERAAAQKSNGDEATANEEAAASPEAQPERKYRDFHLDEQDLPPQKACCTIS